MINEGNQKLYNSKRIIKAINGKCSICRMIRLYIYKILYKKYTLDFFYDENNITKYYLKEYKDFTELIINQLIKINDKIEIILNDNKHNSIINLLNENYNYNNHKNIPFYNYFYYTDYLNEEYIIKKINDSNLKKYPVLRTYLEYHKNPKKEKNKYLLDNLHIFNSALNLICQKYFKKISKGNAIKIRLKEVQIYKENNELFDKFIEFYNNVVIDDLNIKDKLSIDNPLIDFFITDDNRYGRTYKIIYKKCIDLQNNMIINILKEKGIFDTYNQNRYKIQQLDENQIFSLNLPKNTSLIDVLFSSSYRKIMCVPMIDMDCESYDEYVINYDYIEEEMAEILLYHKKLLLKILSNLHIMMNYLLIKLQIY